MSRTVSKVWWKQSHPLLSFLVYSSAGKVLYRQKQYARHNCIYWLMFLNHHTSVSQAVLTDNCRSIVPYSIHITVPQVPISKIQHIFLTIKCSLCRFLNSADKECLNNVIKLTRLVQILDTLLIWSSNSFKMTRSSGWVMNKNATDAIPTMAGGGSYTQLQAPYCTSQHLCCYQF